MSLNLSSYETLLTKLKPMRDYLVSVMQRLEQLREPTNTYFFQSAHSSLKSIESFMHYADQQASILRNRGALPPLDQERVIHAILFWFDEMTCVTVRPFEFDSHRTRMKDDRLSWLSARAGDVIEFVDGERIYERQIAWIEIDRSTPDPGTARVVRSAEDWIAGADPTHRKKLEVAGNQP